MQATHGTRKVVPFVSKLPNIIGRCRRAWFGLRQSGLKADSNEIRYANKLAASTLFHPPAQKFVSAFASWTDTKD
jgi:hypothetical protein